MFLKYFIVTVVTVSCVRSAEKPSKVIPPYVKQCIRNDPKLVDCIIQALNHIKPYLKQGIKEIELPPVEPFKLDSLSLALTGGTNGYKITLKDIDAYGASDFIIQKIIAHSNSPFEGKIKIPRMTLDAKYLSSGVLLVIPATGNGTFHADLDDIWVNIKGNISNYKKKSKEYYRLDNLDIELDIKKSHMKVSNINNNRIIGEATNLFLAENSQEVIQVMMPQLRPKLTDIIIRIINQLLSNVSTDVFYKN
ncbi:uncharacterized protein LOC126910428 [Daktulosphaira vitifoliae]|uniref:uncharacterized protein LOC126910428 n=1 Tax=Daktulosphaira vitifoliae TaxID=58002 RepID=UPI0021A9EAF4|nr:uncharacterized protein LOC126910428 [Daktulosphaira vitifoliae]